MKTDPFDHQAKELKLHGLDNVRAIHWEQGTGKTWLALATAEELYAKGEIDALFILAPPGLHTNWIIYEIPDHLGIDHSMIAFQTKRAKTKKHMRECHAILNNDAGSFPILAMSYPGIKTVVGKKLAKQFLTKHRCLFVCDESNRIKTPSAKITRTVLAASEYADYKRTLCGTPITNTPFDIYTQFRFLDKSFWANTAYGLGSYQCFKTFFGVWIKGYNAAADRTFDQCVGFKNLPILAELVKEMSSRVLKDDMTPKIPEKLYSYAGFEMTAKQWRLYKELEDDFMTEVEGEFIFTPLAITRLLRLQQVANGYLPTGDEGEMHMIEAGKNPRLKILGEITQDLPHKAIIWARFIQDIDLITDMLGDKAVRWDGTVTEDQREKNKFRFKTCPVDEVQYMVATPDSMGEGHTLNEALTSIYYSNSFKMKERIQSEDRNHRAGQINHVNYIDIVADNTKDTYIIASLRKKFDNASTIIDGKLRNWLLQYDRETDILAA
jgi:SNF2 family DNA or RNA helicase